MQKTWISTVRDLQLYSQLSVYRLPHIILFSFCPNFNCPLSWPVVTSFLQHVKMKGSQV